MDEILDDIHSNPLDVYKAKKFDMVSFSAQLEDLGLSDPHELILKSATPDNLIGSGGNADVYEIPGVEDYVLRVSNGRFSANTSVGELKGAEDKFLEINLGQAVATLGGHKILRRQLGIPAGVPQGLVRRSPEAVEIYTNSLAMAADMPQSAYNSLAYLFKFLNDNNLNFDPSKSNNLLIDVDNKRFNPVDLNPSDHNMPVRNDLGRMVVALMDNSFAMKVTDVELNKKLTEFRRSILIKSIHASKIAGLPEVSIDDASLNYSFKLAGIEQQT